jgi:hypothetical protein
MHMEYSHLTSKEVREYLRAADLLLAELRTETQCGWSSYELLAIKVSIERLKTAVLHIENTVLLKTVREDLSRRKAERESDARPMQGEN